MSTIFQTRRSRRCSAWPAWLLCAGIIISLQHLATAHDLFAAYIQHRVLLTVGARYSDLEVDLTFFEEWSARERAGDGTTSHTTPVYVVREGFRFWKLAWLKDLLDKREASLVQIEQVVADARRDKAEGKLEQDRTREQLALQGDLLLERVAIARKLYEELRQTAEGERARLGASKS